MMHVHILLTYVHISTHMMYTLLCLYYLKDLRTTDPLQRRVAASVFTTTFYHYSLLRCLYYLKDLRTADPLQRRVAASSQASHAFSCVSNAVDNFLRALDKSVRHRGVLTTVSVLRLRTSCDTQRCLYYCVCATSA